MTKPAARKGDLSYVPADSHPDDPPVPCTGPISGAVAGHVYINGRQAALKGSTGDHAACTGPNTFSVSAGSSKVYIENIKAARLGDASAHCGGPGRVISGSDNVYIGG